MKTIAVYNNKGGVSKTTTVINVAYTLAETMNKKVLVVDCDGQQNISHFLSDLDMKKGIEEILINGVLPDEVLTYSRYKNIDVLVSTSKMNDCCEVYKQLTKIKQKENLEMLYKFCLDCPYDYVLLDMPPALNSITESMLSITDGVIVPVELGTFAIQGIAKVTETINKVGAAFMGCFISKFDKSNKSDEQLKELLCNTLGNKVFDTVIPYSNIIRNSINYRMTAYEYMNWMEPSRKYCDLTEEILRRVG